MKKRTLGKTATEVSEIGLGCWQFGGDFGAIDDDRAFAVLSAASEAGVTFFDTADVYGGGRSESIIGRYLKDASASPMVATKVGRSAELFPNNYGQDAIRDHLLASAERLGTDTLDLVWRVAAFRTQRRRLSDTAARRTKPHTPLNLPQGRADLTVLSELSHSKLRMMSSARSFERDGPVVMV